MMKRMFHGTVDVFVSAILANGLIPSKEHAWRIRFDGEDELRKHERVNSVHLTESKHRAVQYAKTRVNYFAANPGAKFEMYDAPYMYIEKDEDAPVLYTKAVLVVMDIPEELYKSMTLDPKDYMEHSMVYKGAIPPSMISDIVTVDEQMARTLCSEYHAQDRQRAEEQLISTLSMLAGRTPYVHNHRHQLAAV